MSVICPAKPSISVCGEHSESAVAELADLTFRLVAEMDTDADAGIWLQRSTDHIISLMKKLAPGLPGATIPTTSKPAHIAHPTADTSPIVAYTVARSRTVPSFANNTLSKGASSLMSSKVRKRSAASTTLVVTFRDIPKLEEFANQIVVSVKNQNMGRVESLSRFSDVVIHDANPPPLQTLRKRHRATLFTCATPAAGLATRTAW